MAITAADVLVQTLIDWKVDTVFGMPGDGINGIMESLRKRQDEIRFIQNRHEEASALAAVGYAKFTGRLGVCLATSGPGGIHLLNGLYDAKLDHVPVLAITGLQFHDLMATDTQQDVELDKTFADACVYNARIMGPAHVQNVVELACRTALAYAKPTHVTIPVDVQSLPLAKDARTGRNVPDHVSNLMARGGHCADAAAIERAARLIAVGAKPFILAGRGALGARKELLELAERIAAPVGMALLGKGAIPDDSEFATGGVGLLGTRPSAEAMKRCDTLIIVGSGFPYIEFYPEPGKARAVQIDVDGRRIGLRYPVEEGLVGDSAVTLRALLDQVRPAKDRSFLEAAQKSMKDWRALMAERGTRRDLPMKPQVVTHELNKLLDDDAIVTTDSGTITTWAARHIDIRADRMFSCSGNLATMACAVPYAIGAAIAFPGRQVVAIIGDGGCAMLMGELATLRKYDLNVKVVVIKNDTLGQIKWEQIVFLGNPEYGCDLQPIDFTRVAEGCGLPAWRIEDPADCAGQLQRALTETGPALVEAVVDPSEPPMPPEIEIDQALHLAKALAKGTPGGGRIARTIAKNAVRELV